MKLLLTANGKKKIKISKKEWINLGKKAGWNNKSQINIESAKKIREGLFKIDQLSLPGVPDTMRYSDLDFSEVSNRGYRIIGGDKGDLWHEGYSVDDNNQITYVHKPFLKTGLDLTPEEADEIAREVLQEAFDSVGWECLYHS